MSFRHILRKIPMGSTVPVLELSSIVFEDREQALNEAKRLCQVHGWSVTIMMDTDEVTMAPMVNSYIPSAPPQSIMRAAEIVSQVPDEPEVPKRDPQAKPRLLVLNRRATPAELVAHLMVVAEGKIVKNAFGALELADMPLSSPEHLEVTRALHGVSAS